MQYSNYLSFTGLKFFNIFIKITIFLLFICTKVYADGVDSYRVDYSNQHEKFTVIFDNRKWKIGSSSKDKGMPADSIYDEYILEGDSIYHWSELITIQFYPRVNKKIGIDIYEASIKNFIKNVCPNVSWNSYEQQQNERSWYFTIKNCKEQPDQSEVARLVRTDLGFYIFHYAIKKSPMPKDIKQIWINNLKSIKIIKN